MDSMASELISLLRYLLPGFLAAWVFLGLTAHEKSSQFERIIQAFIFTLFVQFLIAVISMLKIDKFAYFENLAPESQKDIISVICAIIIGLLFSLLANKDWLHSILRKAKITGQTSYPSEWFGAFNTRQKSYVVLHLHDKRRIYGWPHEWPRSSENGHFYVVQASWLVGNGKEHYLENDGVEGILINVKDVKWVEFMKQENDTNG